MIWAKKFKRDWKATSDASLGNPFRRRLGMLFVFLLIAVGTIVVGSFAASAGWIDHKWLDGFSLLVILLAMPTAHLGKAIRQNGWSLWRRIFRYRRTNFIRSASPARLFELTQRQLESVVEPAEQVMPMPGITDVNLAPRLLPVPSARMGVAA